VYDGLLTQQRRLAADDRDDDDITDADDDCRDDEHGERYQRHVQLTHARTAAHKWRLTTCFNIGLARILSGGALFFREQVDDLFSVVIHSFIHIRLLRLV